MVSSVESDVDPDARAARAALAAAERAATLPYTEYPPTPWWYPVSVGAWAAAVLLAVTALREHPFVAVPLLVVLIGAEGAFFAWYRRWRGAMPSLRQVPAEIARAMRWYVVGVLAVVAAVAVVVVLAGPITAAVVAVVLVSGGLSWYERRYAAAADGTRARLAQP
jgi:hypothetical protein